MRPASSRFRPFQRRHAPALVFAVALVALPATAGYVIFGSGGFGSKWDDPVHGTPATVTWGFMTPGTTVDPMHDIAAEVIGGSDVASLRATYDGTYGAGAFDAALGRAFATWSTLAGITFVGPVADGGGAVGAAGATTPDIRVGAFAPVPGSGFSFVAGVGFGPPGNDLLFPDALAGDILLNSAQTFIEPVGAEGDPIGMPGNDLENLFLHELGHAAMGLGHPAEGVGDVMYVGFDCCDLINREPSHDDITAARSVYGLSATPACSDGFDDDGDGLYDLADSGCASAADTSERGPGLACDDGIDDDLDTIADFPNDPGCLSRTDPDETDPNLPCDDGIDNDSDGLIDAGFDPACSSGNPAVPDPTVGVEASACQDGFDNDVDGKKDFDGGQSIHGACGGGSCPPGVSDTDLDGVADPDPECVDRAWATKEKASCGLGFEVLVLISPLLWLRGRRLRRER